MVDRFGISGAGFSVPHKKHQTQHHGFMNMYGDVSDFGGMHTIAEEIPALEMDIVEDAETPVYQTNSLDTKTTELTTKTDEEAGKYTTLVLELIQAEKSVEVEGIT
jgi:hypothetical protein